MDFLTIPESIITREGLTTTEALVLAVINNFSQSEQGIFYGSRTFLQKWAKASHRAVVYALNSLEEKGLIIKGEIYDKGVRRCTYKIDPCKICTSAEIAPVPVQNLHGGSAKIAPIIEIYNKEDNKYNTQLSREEQQAEALRAFDADLSQYAGKYTPQMIEDFRNYWAAPLQHPTKAQIARGIFYLFQEQKTWSMGGRLATWNSRDIQRMAESAARQGNRPRPMWVNDRGETSQAEAFRKSNEAFAHAMEMANENILPYDYER